MITGYGSIVPTTTSEDHVAQITELENHRVHYARIWHFLTWEGANAIWPWQRSDTPGAHMGGNGGNKFDLNVWNPTYWSRIRDAVERAKRARTYTQIPFSDSGTLSGDPGDENLTWGNNPFARDNNVNNLEVPSALSPNGGVPDFYLYGSKPNLRRAQERYLSKMIDETVEHVAIFEIENEHSDYDNADWAIHYGRFIKNYFATLATQHPNDPRYGPRLVSYSSILRDFEELYTAPEIDVMNKHFGDEAERLALLMARRMVRAGFAHPSVLAELQAKATAYARELVAENTLNDYLEPRYREYDKPINVDEFATGVTDTNILRKMCWVIITSGGHFHIEDADPASRPFDVVGNIREFKEQSQWDFVHAAPNKNLANGGGYCLAQPGREYVFYFLEGGTKSVTLEAGDYREEWWNPRSGGFQNRTNFSHPGGTRTVVAPDGNDWVLHVIR